MFYTVSMSGNAPERPPPATFSLKLGQWFEANATGWGILAVPAVVVLLVLASIAGIFLRTGA